MIWMRTRMMRKKKQRSPRTAIFRKMTKKRMKKTTKNSLYTQVAKPSTTRAIFRGVLLGALVFAAVPFACFAKGGEFLSTCSVFSLGGETFQVPSLVLESPNLRAEFTYQEPGQPPPPEPPPAPSSSSKH